MNDFNILVQKFGGSSVSDCSKIKSVASFIKNSLSHNKKICVVVSAMGKTTDNLLSLANELSQNPTKRELDMLLSCGERSSMALLSIALNEIGVKSISLTGSQSGIITDDCHLGAQILEIRPQRVLEAFADYEVVIIAGFQGVSKQKEITTLRRGGSDTTAVAMAAALKACACEIYTDVDGVMSADPNILKSAQTLPTVTFEQMNSMSLFGAKVLAYDASKLAQKFGITLKIAKTNSELSGTSIQSCQIAGINNVIAITHVRSVIQTELSFENEASVPLLYAYLKNNYLIAYTNSDYAHLLPKDAFKKGLALIALHHNDNSLVLFKEVISLLKNNSIEKHDAMLMQNEILLIIQDDDLKKTLTMLHDKFICTG